MDKKPWYKKIRVWILTIAAICTILGISIFDDKSLLDNKVANDLEANLGGDDVNTGNQSPVINSSGDITINYGNTDQDSNLSSNSNILPPSENNTGERYRKGTITKTGWESKFIGLRYTNPEEMTMSTEEELDEMYDLKRGVSGIIFNSYELGEAQLLTVGEMMSKTDDNSTVVLICVERLIDEVNIFQFIEAYESNIDRNPFTNYTLISDDKTMKIGDGDYIELSYIMESNNNFKYMDNYVRIVGDRVIMITIIFDDERARDSVLDAFTAY